MFERKNQGLNWNIEWQISRQCVCTLLSIQLIFRMQAHILFLFVDQTNRHFSKRLTQTQGKVKKMHVSKRPSMVVKVFERNCISDVLIREREQQREKKEMKKNGRIFIRK